MSLTSVLSRSEVAVLVAEAETYGWDRSRAGVVLLRAAESMVGPIVGNVARRHRVPPEEISTATLLAAWRALRGYDSSRSPDPWGWVARVAQRAAVDAAVVHGTGHTGRNRARLAAAITAVRRRLAVELGREPTASEITASLTPAARALANRSGVSEDPVAFTAVSAPVLTDVGVDAGAASSVDLPGTQPSRPCPGLAVVVDGLVERAGLDAGTAEGAVHLAADLVADFFPQLGVAATRRRVVGELTRAEFPTRLTAAQAQRIVDELFTTAYRTRRRPAVAAA